MKTIKLLFIIIIFSSCNDLNNPNNYNNIQKGIYNEDYGILYRTKYQYDILPIVDLEQDLKARYNFEFFNYGEEVTISKQIWPDIFCANIARVTTLIAIDFNYIYNFQPHISKGYGQWGTISIKSFDPLLTVDNVIVTPLATKHLIARSVNDTGEFIFVRFERGNGKDYKDYLFYGDLTTACIIRYSHNNQMCIKYQGPLSDDATDNWKEK